MKKTLKRFIYWEFLINNPDDKAKFFNNKNLIKTQGLFICSCSNKSVLLKVPPQITFTKLCFLLNNTNLCLIKDVSSFAKIALGQRKKYYNWQLVAIGINWNLI